MKQATERVKKAWDIHTQIVKVQTTEEASVLAREKAIKHLNDELLKIEREMTEEEALIYVLEL